ncbi:hypothetical protein J6590_088155 [Homalodisca vitripennis]|nr:hypothetical protein J6590_088155 [Homalodisca vitripennis]
MRRWSSLHCCRYNRHRPHLHCCRYNRHRPRPPLTIDIGKCSDGQAQATAASHNRYRHRPRPPLTIDIGKCADGQVYIDVVTIGTGHGRLSRYGRLGAPESLVKWQLRRFGILQKLVVPGKGGGKDLEVGHHAHPQDSPGIVGGCPSVIALPRGTPLFWLKVVLLSKVIIESHSVRPSTGKLLSHWELSRYLK